MSGAALPGDPEGGRAAVSERTGLALASAAPSTSSPATMAAAAVRRVRRSLRGVPPIATPRRNTTRSRARCPRSTRCTSSSRNLASCVSGSRTRAIASTRLRSPTFSSGSKVGVASVDPVSIRCLMPAPYLTGWTIGQRMTGRLPLLHRSTMQRVNPGKPEVRGNRRPTSERTPTGPRHRNLMILSRARRSD